MSAVFVELTFLCFWEDDGIRFLKAKENVIIFQYYQALPGLCGSSNCNYRRWWKLTFSPREWWDFPDGELFQEVNINLVAVLRRHVCYRQFARSSNYLGWASWLCLVKSLVLPDTGRILWRHSTRRSLSAPRGFLQLHTSKTPWNRQAAREKLPRKLEMQVHTAAVAFSR